MKLFALLSVLLLCIAIAHAGGWDTGSNSAKGATTATTGGGTTSGGKGWTSSTGGKNYTTTGRYSTTGRNYTTTTGGKNYTTTGRYSTTGRNMTTTGRMSTTTGGKQHYDSSYESSSYSSEEHNGGATTGTNCLITIPSITNVTSVSPFGGLIVIFGLNFGNDVTKIVIQIGAFNCSNVVLSGTNKLTCTVLPGVGRDLPIKIIIGCAYVIKNAFCYEAPVVDSCSTPPVGGGRVTIHGKNFGNQAAMKVYLGSIQCTDSVFVDDSTIVCTIPAISKTETVAVIVEVGGQFSNTTNSVVVAIPLVAAATIAPTQGASTVAPTASSTPAATASPTATASSTTKTPSTSRPATTSNVDGNSNTGAAAIPTPSTAASTTASLLVLVVLCALCAF